MKKRLYQALSALGVLLFLTSFYVPTKGEPLMVLGTDTTPPVITASVIDISGKTLGDGGNITVQEGTQFKVQFNVSELDTYISRIAWIELGTTTYFSPNAKTWQRFTTFYTATVGREYYFRVDAWNASNCGTQEWVRVNVQPNTYTLTISCSPSNGGTTSPAPGVTHTYTSGTDVTVTASPNSGYTFSGWTGSVQSSNPTITVKMDSNKSLTANFQVSGGAGGAVAYYTLTVSVNPSGGGSVTKQPNQTSYQNQTQVTLTANPNATYYFTGWSGDASGNNPSITVTMDKNRSITANFARKDAPAGDLLINNQVCKPTNTLYLSTRSLSFVFKPSKSPEEISRVWVEIRGPESLDVNLIKQSDGSWQQQVNLGKDGTYTVNCKLSWAGGTVTVASITFGGQEEVPPGYVKIEYICLPRNGGGLVGARSPVPLGTHIEVEAFPNQGWRFVGWRGDVPPDYAYQKLGFIADRENMTIIAEFESIEPMISTPMAMRIFGVLLILSGAVGWLMERRRYAG